MRSTFLGRFTFQIITGCSLLIVLSAGTLAEQQKVESRVTDVTLYRSQAMVTRTINVGGEAGGSELLVSDLPENIVPSSLFAEGNDQIEVRAVQFRTRAVGSSPREEVRTLNDEIANLNKQLELNTYNTQLVQKSNEYLDKLEGFVAPTANSDLAKGVLDAEALKQMTLFSFEQRKELVERQVELSEELKSLREKLELANRKLREITNGASTTVREAIVFIQKNDAQAQNVRLNYLVTSCGWSPSYTARAEQGSENIRIEYNGLIQQMTGEDWNNVALTLSSASPALSAAGPGLAPFRITLSGPGQTMANMQNAIANGQAGQSGQQLTIQGTPSNIKSLLTQQKQYNLAFQNSVSLGDNIDSNWQMNDAINKFACVELTAEPSVVSAVRNQLTESGDQPAMSYVLKSPVSLSSRNTQQMVRVLQSDLESNFYHIATPILTSYVYREAELSNSSQQDLLAGPITVYLDGRFVGRSEIPTVARGQTFVVGFGADSQLRTRRELVDRKSSFTGGNREINLTYRLVVENYKETPTTIRIVDRIPTMDDGSNIRVTLAPLSTALSKDEVYVRSEEPKGILRWDAEVAARATGKSAHEVEYGFMIEHDRQYQVSLPADFQKQKEEFEEMQNFRFKR